MLRFLIYFILLLSSISFADNPPERIFDHGILKGVAYNLDCEGAGITCTQAGVTGTLTVPGGGTGSPGGSNTNVQYNSSGSFGANSGFNYDGTNVGIGTASAVGKLLFVQGSTTNNSFDINTAGNTSIGNTLGTSLLVVGSLGQTAFNATGAMSSSQIVTLSGSTAINATAATSSINDSATTLGTLTINGGANLGSSLKLQSNSKISGNGSNDAIIFNFGQSSNVGIGTQTVEMKNGNVGIGSVNPIQTLDVNGTVKMTGLIDTTSPTSGYVMTTDSSGNGTWQAATGGSSQWTGTVPGPIIYTQGNVGIGGPVPGGLLDVQATPNTTNIIPTMTSDSTPTGTVSASSEFSASFAAWKALDKDITTSWLDNNSSTGKFIEYDFGVGVTETVTGYTILPRQTLPSQCPANWVFQGSNDNSTWTTLDTESGITCTDGVTATYTFSNTTAYRYFRIFIAGSSGSTSIGELGMMQGANSSSLIVKSGGKIGINQASPINTLDVNGNQVIGNSYAGTVMAPANGLLIQGNVGIGSILPGASLDVIGTLRILGSSNLQVGFPSYSDTGILGQFTSSVAGYNQTILQNTSNSSSASTNFVINNDIGSSSNYAEIGLDSSTFTGTGSLNQANTFYIDNNTGGDLALGTITSNPIHFVVGNSATDAMTISSNGNVGIGSPNPGGLLDVQGTVVLTRINSTGNVSIGTNASTQYLNIGALNQFTVSSAGVVTSGSITSTGNIIPGVNAFIGSSSAAANASTVFRGSASTTGFAEIRSTTGVGATDFIKFTLGSSGALEAMRIQDNSGSVNVGIGTINPGQKLDVVGTLRFTGTLLNTSSGSSIGWTNKAGANTACSTTCGSSTCVFGFDQGTLGVALGSITSCSDATADECICAGP